MVKYSAGLQQIKEKQVSGKLDVAQDLAALNVLHEDLHWALLAASKSWGWGVGGQHCDGVCVGSRFSA